MRRKFRALLIWLAREEFVEFPIAAFPVPDVRGRFLKPGHRAKDGDPVDAVLFNFMLERIDRLESEVLK